MLKILSHFVKTAGVTFSIVGSHKISQPKDLMQIAYDLKSWAWKNLPAHLRFNEQENIVPDGLNVFEFTSTINWYFIKEFNGERLRPFIDQAIKEVLEPLGIKVGEIYQNESQMYNANAFRIPIIENATTELEQLPEIHISDFNLHQLLKLLNMPFDHAGSISAQDLLATIKRAWPRVSEFSRDGFVEKNMIDFGLPTERLEQYLRDLTVIATRALEMNNAKIQWA